MPNPTAFLCHASEDNIIAERLARDLVSNGIPTFYAEWEIRSGDSLRQKIDAGIAGCTHFIVLLTPTSLTRRWVNAELDAGLVLRISGECALIPVRSKLDVAQLPPLLRALYAPALDDYSAGILEIVNDIHGVVRRPPLGAIPEHARPQLPVTVGVSTAAGRIAVRMVETSTKGWWGDPALSLEELRELTSVSDDDLLESIDELESLGWAERSAALMPLGFVRLNATRRLFAALDAKFMGWDPEADAKAVAADLVNGEPNVVSQHLAARLEELGVVDASSSSDVDFCPYSVARNSKTRRFVRSD
jgi:hypothetical protein